jgi:hypothetical protein
LSGEREESGGIRLLSDLRKILKEAFTPTAAILKALAEEDDRHEADIRGNPYRPRFGSSPTCLWDQTKDGADQQCHTQGYYREDFKDAWRRYLHPAPEQ